MTVLARVLARVSARGVARVLARGLARVLVIVNVVALALLSSCGGCPGSAEGPTPALSPTVAPQAKARPVSEWPRWIAGRDAGHDHAAVQVVVGPLRAVIDGGRVELAVDRFAADILFAVPVSDGWIFLAADGAVGRSSGFLGPLRHLGDITPGYRPARVSRGRLAIVDQGGALWTTAGRAPARTLAAETVLVAAFRDPAHGAAVTGDGRLLTTSDSAATWAAVDLGAGAAWDVELRAGALWVRTSDGPLVLDASGMRPTQPVNSQMPVVESRALSSDEDRAVMAALETATIATTIATTITTTITTPGHALAGRAAPRAALPPSPWRYLDQHCSLAGPVERRAPVHVDGRSVDVVRRVRLQRPGARGELAIRRAPDNQLRARAVWRGHDWRGPFHGASKDSALPVIQANDDALYPESTPYRLFGASRHGLVVERCADEAECELLWIAHDGAITRIQAPGYRDGVDFRLRASATNDNTVVLWFTATLMLEAPDMGRDIGQRRREQAVMPSMRLGLDQLLALAPDGRERVRRTFVRTTVDTAAGLAHYHGALGFAAASASAPESMGFHGLDRISPLGGPPGGLDTLGAPGVAWIRLAGRAVAPIRPCAQDPAPDVVRIEGLVHHAVVTTSDIQITVNGNDGGDGDIAATVELGPTGVCLRELQAPVPPVISNDHALMVSSSAEPGRSGQLGGHFDEQDQRFVVQCVTPADSRGDGPSGRGDGPPGRGDGPPGRGDGPR